MRAVEAYFLGGVQSGSCLSATANQYRRDLAQAIAWYPQVSRSRRCRSLNPNLAVDYEHGIGVPQDYSFKPQIGIARPLNKD
jgi:TPR repeat protein